MAKDGKSDPTPLAPGSTKPDGTMAPPVPWPPPTPPAPQKPVPLD